MKARKTKTHEPGAVEGEKLAWFELAFQLRMPVAELKRRITYSEFLDWMEFLRARRDADEKEHYYLAQIAAEIRRSNPNVPAPGKVRISDFLLKFREPFARARISNSEAEKRHTMMMSKAAWMTAVKCKPEDN